jgi:hypothetical protein
MQRQAKARIVEEKEESYIRKNKKGGKYTENQRMHIC